MSGIAQVVIGAAGASVAVLTVVSLTAERLRPLFAEDALVEWFGFAGFFLAAMLLSISMIRPHGRLWRALLAVGLLLTAGEEISWGQRVFGWQPPPFFAEGNLQGETNVHNLRQVQESTTTFGLAALFVLGFVEPLLRRWRVTDDFLSRWHVWRMPGVGIVLIASAITLIVAPRLITGRFVQPFDEGAETLAALGCLSLSVRDVTKRVGPATRGANHEHKT